MPSFAVLNWPDVEQRVTPQRVQNTDPTHVLRLREYLDGLLASGAFGASERRKQLLRYLVERTLQGLGSQVNEYAIGIDVFHKLQSFDPRTDSVVRTDIARLRQRLKAYYEGPGRNDPIVLDLLPRSYTVAIDYRNGGAPLHEPSAGPPPELPLPPARQRRWGQAAALAALLLIGVVAGVGWWMYRASHPRALSLVVLPFRNFTADKDAAHLADGLTEELTNQFAQWKDVRVVSRTSAFVYKDKDVDIREVGRRLNVDEAIEGSFQKQGERVRITAQMVRTSDGSHLWSHAYDESALDMMTVEEDIARSITREVRNLGRKVPDTRNLESSADHEAHDLYLRGSSELVRQTEESTTNAEKLLRAAIARDPKYAAAYFRLAQAEYQHLQSLGTLAPADVVSVRAHLEKALQLEPDYGEARGALAAAAWAFEWDWPRAEREFRRALEQGAGAMTHSVFGAALASRGRFAEAHEQFKMAAGIDPLSSGWKWNEGGVYLLEGNWARAEEMTRLVLDVEPGPAHSRLLMMAVMRRDCARADAEAAWLRQQSYAASANTQRTLALASACHGDREQAERYLAAAAKPTERHNFYLDAFVYAVLHQTSNALNQLERSVEAREAPAVGMKYQQMFSDLRLEPRFIALERRLGLER